MIAGINLAPLWVEGHPFRIFVWAVFASASLELVNALRIYEAGRPFPARYKRFRFWLVRAGITLVGAGTAIMLRANTDLLAFQIGLTTPALLISMASRTPEPVEAD